MLKNILQQAISGEEVSLEGFSNNFDPKVIQPLVDAVTYIQNNRLSTKTLEESNIGPVLKKLTGIDYKLGIDEYDTCTIMPILKPNEVLATSVPREIMQSNRTDAADLKINPKDYYDVTVDTERMYATGASLKRFDFYIFFGADIYGIGRYVNTTVAEGVAGVLHEVGHLMTKLLSLAEVGTTCSKLNDLSDDLLGTNDVKKKRTIIGNYKSLAGISDQLVAAKSKEEIVVISLNQVNQEMVSRFGFNPLENRNSEYLADEFVTKWGYGRQLASTLDKLVKAGIVAKDPWQPWAGAWMVGAIALIINPVFGALFIPLGLAFDIGTSGMGAEWTMSNPYGTVEERIKALRKSMIGRLKDAPNKDIIRQMLYELDATEVIVKDNQAKFPILFKIGVTIFPNTAGKSRYLRATQLAEDFAQAELNIHIEKLKDA